MAWGRTRYRPYDPWWVSVVGIDDPVGPEPSVVIMLRHGQKKSSVADYTLANMSGEALSTCNAYARKGSTITQTDRQMMQKVLTALVSLGVNYEPNAQDGW